MDDAVKEYRRLLATRYPDLQEALELLSDPELRTLIECAFHLTNSLTSVEITMAESQIILDQYLPSPTIH